MTALISASKEGHLEIVKHLVEKDADINIKNNNGDTALILASNLRDNNDRCIINSILINATSHKSNTILSDEDLKTMAVLMKNGLTFENSNCGMGFGTHDIKNEFNTSNITIHIRNKKTKEEQHLEYNKDDIEKGI